MALGDAFGFGWDTVYQNPNSGMGGSDPNAGFGGYGDGTFDIDPSAYTDPSSTTYGPSNDYFGSINGSYDNSTGWGTTGYDPGIISNYDNYGGDSFGMSNSPYSDMGGAGGLSSNNYVTGLESNGLFGSEIEKYAKNPLIRMLMSLHPATALLNAAARGPGSLGGAVGSMLGSGAGALGSLFGGGIGSGLGNLAGGKDVSFSSFLPSAGAIGGLGGAMLGGGFGGYGGLLGSMGGSWLGNQAANASGGGFTPGINPGGQSMVGGGGGGFLGSLFGGGDINGSALGLIPSLYAANRNNSSYNSQINNLNQLFSPNSAYAQDMRKQLERRDAAGGRRSQYGSRETELQAKLATLAAAQAPQISNLTNQKNANRNLLIQTALRNPGVQNLIKQGGMSLLDLFKSSPTADLGSSNAYSGFDTSTLPDLIANTGGWLGNVGGGSEPNWGF